MPEDPPAPPPAPSPAAPPARPADQLTGYALATPDKRAVIDDRPGQPPLVWTFRELEDRANQLGHVLVDLGVTRGTKVVWCGQNSAALIAMMHAARKIGATAVPLNYRLSPDEATYVVDNSDAVLVYVDEEYASLIEAIRDRTPKVEHVLVFDRRTGHALAAGHVDADQLTAVAPTAPPTVSADGVAAAAMIYTSGTTGKPKGALRNATGDPAQTLALIAHLGYRSDDIYLTTGPLYHSGPGGFMALAHALGQTVVVQHRFEPEDWLRLLDTYRVTSTFSAPTPIRMVCHLPAEVKAGYDRSSMRIMVANAAPWSLALKQLYLADFPPESLWEVYGSTELGVDTVLAPADQLRKPGSCGLAAPGVEIVLFAEDGTPVEEPNVAGELYVRAANVFNTYYKAQDKYDADTRGDYHTVGDIAYRDDEGYYYICDRKNDMIISGGMNIYPAEIEAALETHPDVADVAVFGIPDEQWGEAVHAVAVLHHGATLDQAGLVAFAREHLAGYKVPRSVSFAEELPRTGSGKLLKRQLREPYWEGRTTRV
jgi:fatty-acyl-CoA synthase/long-chain acyl-CoA synthetase